MRNLRSPFLLALTLCLVLATVLWWRRDREGGGLVRPAGVATAEPANHAVSIQPVIRAVEPSKVASSHPPASMAVPPAKVLPVRAKSMDDAAVSNAAPQGSAFEVAGDKYARAEVIAERGGVDLNTPAVYRRTRLVRVADFKYPLLRVDDEVEVRKPGQAAVKSQQALVADHVIVRPLPGAKDLDVAAALNRAGAKVRQKMPASGIWLVSFTDVTLDAVSEAVASVAVIGRDVAKFAEPDFVVHASVLPDDASFGSLWGLHNTGQSSGVLDADIDAPEAWDLSTGSRDVLVGLIDTGIDRTHPDLAANMWVNPHEIAGNGIDDDGNGYIDDVHGWDFANDDNDPMDDNRHGTHCAGTIGGVGNNGQGVAGVNWQVSLVGLKFLSSSGSGATSDAVEATAYGTSIHVTLTSNSWGGGGYSQALKDAIDGANAAGILFVAAAGNNSTNTDASLNYPSCYASPNIISVAATTRTDTLASFSNYGLTTVDLGAPGSEIYSTVPGGGYDTLSGTSMATPHVSGACALLKAINPSLTAMEIKDTLLSTTDAVSALAGKCVSGGRLNINNALLQTADMPVTPGSSLAVTANLGAPVPAANQTYTLTNRTPASIAWTVAVDKPWVTLSRVGGTLGVGASSSFDVTLNTGLAAALRSGTSVATITVTNTTSGRVQKRTVTVTIVPPPVYAFDLNTDPGWPRTGQWEYGQPRGGGSASGHGSPDPTSGVTGANVFGVNLNGDYSLAVGGPYTLTAGPFDLADYRNVRLQFKRWLNTDYEPWVSALVELSTDNSNWTTIWRNGGTFIGESQWSMQDYDIAGLASKKPHIWIRWSYAITSSTGVWSCSGWNIDDIKILGEPDHLLTLSPPLLAIAEGDPPKTMTLTIAPAPIDATSVILTNTDSTQLSVPVQVVVPAGQTTVEFPVSAVDDSIGDGTQQAVVSAKLEGYPSPTTDVLIHDSESRVLTLSMPAEVPEGTGDITTQVTLSLPAPSEALIRVKLASSDKLSLEVPDMITIPVGVQSVHVPAIVPDDDLIDGPEPIMVTATVQNWPLASASVNVVDNEEHTLRLELPKSAGEPPFASYSGRVKLSGKTQSAISITLTSSDASEITVPLVVTIPAGGTEATFGLQTYRDNVVDGTQRVVIGASSPGFTSSEGTVLVWDEQTPAVPTSPEPADQQARTGDSPVLRWLNDGDTGNYPDNFDVYLGRTPVLTAKEKLGNTANHQWTLARLKRGVTYYWRVVSRLGVVTSEGPVWQFMVPSTGKPARYQFIPLAKSYPVNTPFRVAITAFDEFGNVATDDAGPLALSAAGNVISPQSVRLTKGVWDGAVRMAEAGKAVVIEAHDAGGHHATSGAFNITTKASAIELTPLSSTPVRENQGRADRVFSLSAPLSSKPQKFTIRALEDGQIKETIATLPAAVRSVDLALDILDNLAVDGPRTVTIEAWAPGYNSAFSELAILDDESVKTTVEAPASVAENGSVLANAGTIRFSAPASRDLTVAIKSSLPSRLQVPPSVTMPAGQTAISFSLMPGNNNYVDGDESVTLTASVAGWIDGVTGVLITDDEPRTLTVVTPLPLKGSGEGTPAGQDQGLVQLSGLAAQDLTVHLTNADTSQLIVPDAITIAQGTGTAAFPITYVDDSITDGSVSVNVTASAPTFSTGSGSVSITDNDVHHFDITPLPASIVAGQTTLMTVTARDLNGQEMLAPAGPIAMSASGIAGAVACTPDSLQSGETGLWNIGVRLLGVDTQVRVKIESPTATSVSTPADVVRGPVVKLDAAAISASIPQGMTKTRTIHVSNAGSVPLTWSLGAAPAMSSSFTERASDSGSDPEPVLENLHGVRGPGGEAGVIGPAFTKQFAVLTPDAGTLAPGASVDLVVTLNSTGFAIGAQTIDCYLNTNDYLTGSVPLHVTMQVMPPVHHFAFDPVPASVMLNQPLAVTITAMDALGNVVPDFDQSVRLSAGAPELPSSSVRIVTYTGYADTSATGEYLHTKQAISRYFTNYVETAISNPDPAAIEAALANADVFLIVEQELAYGTSVLGPIGTSWGPVLQNFVSNGGTVIACSFMADEPLLLKNAGLMQVSRTGYLSPGATMTRSADDFLTAGVPASFAGQYFALLTTTDAAVSVRDAAGSRPVVIHRSMGLGRTILIGTDYFTIDTDMDRIIANAVSSAGSVSSPVAPETSGLFANGVWTGDVRMKKQASATRLVAKHLGLGVSGSSNPFSVVVAGDASVAMAKDLAEGQGERAGAATLSVSAAQPVDTVFALVASAPEQLIVPASVVLPAGQLSVSFPLTPVDDTLLDGTQLVEITASGAGFADAKATSAVADNDSTALSLILPPSGLTEGASYVGARVLLARAPDVDFLVTLSSSSSRLSVPSSVTISRGSTSATFTITATNNTLIDGDESVTISAVCPATAGAAGAVLVKDNESRSIIISPATGIVLSEGAGTVSSVFSVQLGGVLAAPLSVQVQSSDLTEVQNAMVTLAAGVSQGTFSVAVVNDTLQDGPQNVVLTASAPGFLNGSATLTILDDEIHHLDMSSIASQQVRNKPFEITVAGKDVSGATLAGYVGSHTFTLLSDGVPVPFTVAPAGSPAAGVRAYTITVTGDAAHAVLTATDNVQGLSVQSSMFSVGAGAVATFAWDSISPHQRVGVPFNVTLTAWDELGNLVTDYTGPVALNTPASGGTVDIGSGTTTLWPTFTPAFTGTRHQMLYRAGEVGPARTLTGISISVASPGSGGIDRFTIRLKHSPKLGFTSGAFESTDWVKVLEITNLPVPATGWGKFDFATPFEYDGASSLLVEVCCYNPTPSGSGNSAYGNAPAWPEGQASVFSSSGSGDPLTWTLGATDPNRLNIKLWSPAFTPGIVSPASSGPFVNGKWSGPVTITAPAKGLRIEAKAASGASGRSSVIDAVDRVLSLQLTPPSGVEGQTLNGVATLNTVLSAPLDVTLSSSDPAIATVTPVLVTIPAGKTSASFAIQCQDDAMADGQQTVVITASAGQTTSANASLAILDNEADHFAVDPIGDVQIKGKSFPVTVRAMSVDDKIVASYAGTVSLSFVDSAGAEIATDSWAGFSNGAATGSVVLNVLAENVVLKVTEPGTGRTAQSNPFSIRAGVAESIEWSIPSQHQSPGVAFPVTLTARDVVGNVASSFAGPVSIKIQSAPDSRTIGSGSLGLWPTLTSSTSGTRHQMLYRAGEIGPAGDLSGLSFNVLSAGNGTVDRFTIRLKHSPKLAFTSGGFDTTDWATVVQITNQPTAVSAGWLRFDFDTPFHYDGISSLLVEVCCFNPTTGGVNASVAGNAPAWAEGSASIFTTSTGDPLLISGGSQDPNRLNLMLWKMQTSLVRVLPDSEVSFVNGVWSGPVTITESARNVRLIASSGAIAGLSPPIDAMKRQLQISIPSPPVEGATAAALIMVDEPLVAPLTVTITSSDSSRALANPASVVIPAGSLSAPFGIECADNLDADGAHAVTLTATAEGSNPASKIVSVADNDLHHFSFDPVGPVQVKGLAFPVRIVARSMDGSVAESYTGSVSLSCTGDAGLALPVGPGLTGSFVRGASTVNVTVSEFASIARLHAEDGYGHDGESDTFSLGVGGVASFNWSNIYANQRPGVPFKATITALDVAGNVATSFIGKAALSATARGDGGQAVRMLTFSAYSDMGREYPNTLAAISRFFSNFTVTTTTSASASALKAALADKDIFLIPEQENVSTSVLTTLGGQWAGVLNDFVGRGGMVIVCSNHNGEETMLDSSGLMHCTRFASASASNVALKASNFLTAGLPASFSGEWMALVTSSDGVVSLTDGASGKPVVLHRQIGAGFAIFIGTDYYTAGMEMDRVIANAVKNADRMLPAGSVAPAQTGLFANGVWTGSVTISKPQPVIALNASFGTAIKGRSNSFTVADPSYTLAGPVSLAEGLPGSFGTITSSFPVGVDTAFRIVSSPTAQLRHDARAVLSAGSTTLTFPLDAVDDTVPEDSRGVSVTVFEGIKTTAPASQKAIVTLADNDPHHFGFTMISAAQMVGAPFNVTVSALSPRGIVLSNFTGMPSLGLYSGTSALNCALSGPGSFAGGQWTGDITPGQATASAVLRSRLGTIVSSSTVFKVTAPAASSSSAAASLVVAAPPAALRLDRATSARVDLNALRLEAQRVPERVRLHRGPELGAGLASAGADDETYAIFQYRRRIARTGITYVVETSTDLKTWTADAGDVTEVSVSSDADGATEVVSVRLSTVTQKFVRVRIAAVP